MAILKRRTLAVLALLAGLAIAAIAGFVWSGTYNIGADDPHWRPTHAVMETVRERSIEARANDLDVPGDLDDPARIRQGAGNYAAMCMECHLAPGMGETELSKGLYPAPPDLTRHVVDAASAFWVIKHGIKASGMPAWGKSMDDVYIWNMVAFLQKMPKLSAAQYDALVASSGGHSHGGGETTPHAHAGSAPAHGADHVEGSGHHETQTKESKPHSHPPGTPAHDDNPRAPAAQESKPHIDPPGTPPHEHDTPAKPDKTPAEPGPHDHETDEEH